MPKFGDLVRDTTGTVYGMYIGRSNSEMRRYPDAPGRPFMMPDRYPHAVIFITDSRPWNMGDIDDMPDHWRYGDE